MATAFHTARFTSILLIASLAGCASEVKRHDEPEKRAAYFAGGGKLARDVTLTVSDAARSQLASNPGFNQGHLLSTVKRKLEARSLLAAAPDPSLPTIDVVITDVRVRSNFSAVFWGFMAGSDILAGDVIARNHDGKELQRFSVNTSYALGGFAGGQDSTRMNWLYESFANELIKELTGGAQN